MLRKNCKSHSNAHRESLYAPLWKQRIKRLRLLGFESPIRKVAQMCLKKSPHTTYENFHKHPITNQESVSSKEMMHLNDSR